MQRPYALSRPAEMTLFRWKDTDVKNFRVEFQCDFFCFIVQVTHLGSHDFPLRSSHKILLFCRNKSRAFRILRFFRKIAGGRTAKEGGFKRNRLSPPLPRGGGGLLFHTKKGARENETPFRRSDGFPGIFPGGFHAIASFSFPRFRMGENGGKGISERILPKSPCSLREGEPDPSTGPDVSAAGRCRGSVPEIRPVPCRCSR